MHYYAFRKYVTGEKTGLACAGRPSVRTPVGVPIEAPESILSVAKQLNDEISSSWILDQYNNPEIPALTSLGLQRRSGTKLSEVWMW